MEEAPKEEEGGQVLPSAWAGPYRMSGLGGQAQTPPEACLEPGVAVVLVLVLVQTVEEEREDDHDHSRRLQGREEAAEEGARWASA